MPSQKKMLVGIVLSFLFHRDKIEVSGLLLFAPLQQPSNDEPSTRLSERREREREKRRWLGGKRGRSSPPSLPLDNFCCRPKLTSVISPSPSRVLLFAAKFFSRGLHFAMLMRSSVCMSAGANRKGELAELRFDVFPGSPRTHIF